MVVEKIFSLGESWPEGWAAEGTTGYDFIRLLDQLQGHLVKLFEATDELKATWYMTERSPYMVLAEIPTPNGVLRITGVSLD